MTRRRVLLALLLIFIVGGAAAWRALRPPVVGGVPFKQLPAQEKQRRRKDAQTLETQVRELARAARKDQRQSFRLVATEDQLNTLVQDRLDLSRAPLKDITIGLAPDEVDVQGTVPYNGLDVVATLSGQIRVQDGKLQYSVKSLKLAGFNAPKKLRARVEREVSKHLNAAFAQAPGHIESATVEQGQLAIEGVTN